MRYYILRIDPTKGFGVQVGEPIMSQKAAQARVRELNSVTAAEYFIVAEKKSGNYHIYDKRAWMGR